jgi:glycogen synthase
MNIVYYSYDHPQNPFCGGGGAYRDLMIHRLIAQRHSVRFFCGKFKEARNYSEDGIAYSFLGSAASYVVSRITFAFLATFHALFVKADLVVIAYSVFSPVLSFLFRGRNTILEMFHLTGQGPFRKYSVFGMAPFLAEQLALRGGKHFICINNEVADAIRTGYKKESVRTVYTGFDTGLLSGSRSDVNYLLFLGRIDVYMKGIDILIDAYEKISDAFRNHGLVLAGRGSLHDVAWLRNRIQTSPDRKRITFYENVSTDKKAELFHNATFVCLPSRFEGWCIAAIEAAASSKATLGTRTSGLSESIRENETGILAAPENADELSQKMSLLLSDANLRTRLGNNGPAWARNFTWEKISADQEAFYVSVFEKQE